MTGIIRCWEIKEVQWSVLAVTRGKLVKKYCMIKAMLNQKSF